MTALERLTQALLYAQQDPTAAAKLILNLIESGGESTEGVVKYNSNGDIEVEGNIIMKNNGKLLGKLPNGTDHVLIESATYGTGESAVTQVEVGNELVHLNFNSANRPSLDLPSSQKEDIAYVSDI